MTRAVERLLPQVQHKDCSIRGRGPNLQLFNQFLNLLSFLAYLVALGVPADLEDAACALVGVDQAAALGAPDVHAPGAGNVNYQLLESTLAIHAVN